MAATLCLITLSSTLFFAMLQQNEAILPQAFVASVSPPPYPHPIHQDNLRRHRALVHSMESPRTVIDRMSRGVWLYNSTPGARWGQGQVTLALPWTRKGGQQASYCAADSLRCIVITEKKESYLLYKPKHIAFKSFMCCLKDFVCVFFFFFKWRIIALQCCVAFCHKITLISHKHLHIDEPKAFSYSFHF